MTRLTLDRIRDLLPDLAELRPLRDLAVRNSVPDPERTWAASGELDTVGGRVVDADEVGRSAAELAEAERRRLETVYEAVGRALRLVGEDEPARAAEALLEVAALEEEADRPASAEAYALAASRIVRDCRDRRPLALALRRAARAARAGGRLTEAGSRYEEAHRLARDSFDTRGAAEAAVGRGNVLEQQGRWEEAIVWYRRALEALEDVDGPAPERWPALLNIHIALRSLGRLEESRAYLERATEEAEALGEPRAEAYLANARGQLRMAAGDFGGAEEALRRALAAAPGGAPAVVVRINLAESLLARGRTLEAAEEARQAEREALLGGGLPRLPEVYRLLGRIAALEDQEEAFVFFERALTLVRERGLPPLEEAMTLQAYAALEGARGDDEAAERLTEEAERIYRRLGIEHMRSDWSDTFGPDPADPSAGEEQ